MGRVGSV